MKYSEYFSKENFFVKNKAYSDYKDDFDNNLELFHESENIKDKLSGSNLDEWNDDQKASAMIYLRSQQILISILILCNEGNQEDAGVLLRSLFENFINIKYIIKHKLGNQFLKYEIIDKKIFYDNYEKHYPNDFKLKDEKYIEFKKNLNRQFEDIKCDFTYKNGRIRKRWISENIRTMCQNLGEEISYDYIFRIYSRFVHPDISGMKRFVKYGKGNINFDNSPATKNVKEILSLTSHMFARIVIEFASLLNVSISSKFNFVHDNQ